MKSFLKRDDKHLPTFSAIFKFDITLENIERMASYYITKHARDAKRIPTQETSFRSK